jgi:Tfp pilus assembly protein PilO
MASRSAKSAELKAVRNEIKELRMLYEQMLDRVLPVQEPTGEERERQ